LFSTSFTLFNGSSVKNFDMKYAALMLSLLMLAGFSAAATSSNHSLTLFKIQGVCSSGNSSNISDVSYYTGSNDSRIVEFEGAMRSSNPCQRMNHSIEYMDDGRYVLNVETVPPENRAPCVECIGEITYKSYFVSEQPFKLEVRHDGSTVEVLEHDEVETENSSSQNRTNITKSSEDSPEINVSESQEIDEDNGSNLTDNLSAIDRILASNNPEHEAENNTSVEVNNSNQSSNAMNESSEPQNEERRNQEFENVKSFLESFRAWLRSIF